MIPEGLIPETVFGVPSHPLFIHAVVVLVPLSALAVLVMAVLPRSRPVLRWPVLLVLTAALGAVPVATTSGNILLANLQEQQALGGTALEKVVLHQQLGNLVFWPVLALWVLTVALVALDLVRRRPGGRRGPLGTRGGLVAAVAALAVIAGAASVVQVVRTGHAGATAVWNPGG